MYITYSTRLCSQQSQNNAIDVNYLYEVSIYNELKHINAFTKKERTNTRLYALYTSNSFYTFALLTVPW